MTDTPKRTALSTDKLFPSRRSGMPPDQSKVDMLAESIRDNGILTPLRVRRVGDKYEILNGEACWLAAKQLGMDIVPAEIVQIGGRASAAQVELRNTARESISPDERILGLERLVSEFGSHSASTVLEQLPQLLVDVEDDPDLKPRLNKLLDSCGLGGDFQS